MKDIKDFYDARNDPFYIETVIADEERFVASREGASWTIGWEEVYIKDSEIVNLPHGILGSRLRDQTTGGVRI